MRRNKLYIILLLTLTISVPLRSQPFSDDVKNILQIQDTRDIKRIDDLQNYMNPLDPQLVKRSLIALANIADSNYINYINTVMVNSTCADCRKTAAFAMGQIPCTSSPKYLTIALSGETEPAVIAAILESLGKTGDENVLQTVVSYNSDNNIINVAIAYSIDKFARRNIKNNDAVVKISQLINSTGDINTLRNCANALFSINNKELLSPVKYDIMILTRSADNETRMKAFSTLGVLKDTSVTEYLLQSLKIEKDWRIRVNILYSLVKMKDVLDLADEGLCTALLNAADDENDNVEITALQVLGRIYSSADSTNAQIPKIAEKLHWFMIPYRAVNWSVIVEAIKSYAGIFRDKVKDELLYFYKTTDDYDLKAAVIESFVNMKDVSVYKDIRKAISADVQKFNEENGIRSGKMISNEKFAKLYRSYCNGLFLTFEKADTSEYNNIRLTFTEFLGSKDLALVNTCMNALMLPIFEKYRPETAKVMMLEYSELEYPKDRIIMQIFAEAFGELKVSEAKKLLEENLLSKDYDIAKASSDALRSITGKNYDNRITAKKYRTDFDWNYIDSLAYKKIVLIKTNLGDIKIELFLNEAPFTVQNFLKLAEKKHYDGIIFHRVVPNFVIQAGDPTKTGFGGPDYSIRTEISQLKFETGTLGMASSGKDTEGSQFFITHSPQPHLDGKYTIFGKVIDGMDVVNRIQVGDYIESVEVGK